MKYLDESGLSHLWTKIKAKLNIEMPDYVVAEAESVITRVLEAQKNRCFTFACITDLHYGNADYTDGIKHACQALNYINERIKLDMVAVLGDYTDGYVETQYANATNDFKTINKVLNSLRFSPNIRIPGNHDYYEGHKSQINRFINCYSDDVVWGDIVGGYFYKDFEDYKIRIIGVNTAETDTTNISVTVDQYKWFINTLDLTDKDDVSEWQILVLSHHPLDYWENNNTYRFGQIINAYKTGSNWSDSSMSCDFTGKNSAILIGNIHGHIHNLLVDYIRLLQVNDERKTTVLRMATPEACINRSNQYSGEWGEETTYNKTKNSEKDTSFVIYCIDLDENIIRAICYGAGYDRVRSYIKELITFKITNNLTDVTSNNSLTTIEEGSSYTAVLTPSIGELYSVVVTMDGTNITDSCYSDGIINIENVTGDIIISAVAREVEPEVSYTNLISNSIDTSGAIYNGKGYKTGVRLNSGGTETAQEGAGCTGFMPISQYDTVYLKNCNFTPYSEGENYNYCYLHFYDETFTKIEGFRTDTMSNYAYKVDNVTTDPTTGYITSFTFVDKYNNHPNLAYFRMSMINMTGDEVITVNEPIE